MTYATCTKCHSEFWREEDQHWKRLCVSCWRESKTQATYTCSGNRDSGIEARLRADLESWRIRAQRAEQSLAAHTCPPAALDLATLKRIRALCHPDRHGNSAMSNEISQRINQMIRRAG